MAISAPSLSPAERRREVRAVQALVVALVAGSNAHDPSVCNRLYTLRYLEQTTGSNARAAIRACRKQVAGDTTRVTLARIERVELRRGAGTRVAGRVQYLENADGQLARAILLVHRHGREYVVDGGLPAEQPR